MNFVYCWCSFRYEHDSKRNTCEIAGETIKNSLPLTKRGRKIWGYKVWIMWKYVQIQTKFRQSYGCNPWNSLLRLWCAMLWLDDMLPGCHHLSRYWACLGFRCNIQREETLKDALKRINIPENSGEDNVIDNTDSKMDHKSEVCGKRVKNELTSKRHMENEHDGERNTCKICGETVKYWHLAHLSCTTPPYWFIDSFITNDKFSGGPPYSIYYVTIPCISYIEGI